MENQENAKSLSFTKEDFFNVYEMKNFVRFISQVEDVDTYMKQAIINRVMIDTQSEENAHYDKLIGYIQSKGIEQVLNLIEKKQQSPVLDEKEVERIVLRVMQERNFSTVSVIREEHVEMKSAKTQEKPLDERKKPSSKLRDL